MKSPTVESWVFIFCWILLVILYCYIPPFHWILSYNLFGLLVVIILLWLIEFLSEKSTEKITEESEESNPDQELKIRKK